MKRDPLTQSFIMKPDCTEVDNVRPGIKKGFKIEVQVFFVLKAERAYTSNKYLWLVIRILNKIRF